MKRMLMLCLVVMALNACTQAQNDLKSPCVGAEGSPCDRRPVNSGQV